MIPEGLPSSREEWPEELWARLPGFRQGSLIADLPFVYFGNPMVPIHELSRATGGDQSATIVEYDGMFDYGILVSQTCDIREEDARRPVKPWVQVAPVYRGDLVVGANTRLAKDIMGHAQAGRVSYLFPIPGLDSGRWFADLRLTLPVEKSVLLDRSPIDGLQSEDNYQRFADRLMSVSGRPAFDGRFVKAVQRSLIDGLRELSGTNAQDYDSICRDILEFRVSARSFLEMDQFELVCLTAGPISPESTSWIAAIEATIRQRCDVEGLSLLRWSIVDADSMTATEYRRSLEVPLTEASPGNL